MQIQLSGNANIIGYRRSESNPFEFDAVYRNDAGFTGTEAEFLRAGLAYEYVQVDRFTRVVTA